MKVEILSSAEIQVTVTNRKDLLYLLSVTGVDKESDEYFLAVANLAQAGTVTLPAKACRSSLEANGGFIRIEQRLEGDDNPLRPYWDKIKKVTGAAPFDIDLLPGLYSPRICHTHYLETLIYEAEKSTLVFSTVFELFHWQGKVFEGDEARLAKAVVDATDRIKKRLLRTETLREYIQLDNGLYKRNPNYPGGPYTKFTQQIEDEKLLLYMGNQWLERFGTPGQKALIERVSAYPNEAWISDRCYGDSFHLDNFTASMSYADFQKL